MPADHVDVIALHCDQGMATMVKICDAADRVLHLILIDFGSTCTSRCAPEDVVLGVLKTMAHPKIDVLIVSHQDKDHWSKLPALYQKVHDAGLTWQIDYTYYGGKDWGTSATKAQLTWPNAIPLQDDYSSYSTVGVKQPLFSLAGVTFYVLSANISDAGTNVKNGTSAVIVIEYGNPLRTAILTGDATIDTLVWINNKLEPWQKSPYGSPITNCWMLEVPHHGALATLTTNADWSAKTTTFVNYVTPLNIVASAGAHSQYSHPHKIVLDHFSTHVRGNAPLHYHVYFDDASTRWVEEQCQKGVFTTVLRLDGTFLDQRFTIYHDGRVTFHIGTAPGAVPGTGRESFGALPLCSRGRVENG
ncbi:hypothetical protein GA0070606_0502 [Micromonospora citrea]|uniref:Metallo-beta-lactamase domain-containing protein n=1 Tax=Micromonospora citrea TaxID=47855 RepID=A0A1C6TSY5_9ACTN|nr:hypothetical protein [Micromonospora citrea]SCL44890.1 hypothetical protein GA0070606_0502 [Micromonospora citrea]